MVPWWLIIMLLLVYFVICLLLMGVILIQSGKGGGLSSLGSSSSGISDALGATSAEKTLNKITTGIAVSFMVLAIILSIFGSRVTGGAAIPDDLFDGPAAGAAIPIGTGATTGVTTGATPPGAIPIQALPPEVQADASVLDSLSVGRTQPGTPAGGVTQIPMPPDVSAPSPPVPDEPVPGDPAAPPE